MIHTILFLYLSLVPNLFAETVKTIKLCEKSVAIAYVSTRGTVFEFPTEPEKVVLGTKIHFQLCILKVTLRFLQQRLVQDQIFSSICKDDDLYWILRRHQVVAVFILSRIVMPTKLDRR